MPDIPLVRGPGSAVNIERSFFVSVRGESVDEITELWTKLSDGATVVQDLGPAGWAPLYRMLSDRFGIVWVLDVLAHYHGS